MDIKDIKIKEFHPWYDHECQGGGFAIYWSANIGFGELRIHQFIEDKTKLLIDTEGLGKEFAKQVLCKLIDEAEEVE
jgi:hypothetical protein